MLSKRNFKADYIMKLLLWFVMICHSLSCGLNWSKCSVAQFCIYLSSHQCKNVYIITQQPFCKWTLLKQLSLFISVPSDFTIWSFLTSTVKLFLQFLRKMIEAIKCPLESQCVIIFKKIRPMCTRGSDFYSN